MSSLLDAQAFGLGKPPCPVCAAARCTCKGANEPYVGPGVRLDLEGNLRMTAGTIVAQERIYRDHPEGMGRELVYAVGDTVRPEDVERFGIGEDGTVGGSSARSSDRPPGEPKPKKRTRSRSRKATTAAKGETDVRAKAAADAAKASGGKARSRSRTRKTTTPKEG